MSTNVPSVTWSNGSPVLPSEQAILVGVQADINAAFNIARIGQEKALRRRVLMFDKTPV